MAVTPLPSLDRTAATFKTDTDTFFASQLPTFSVQVNQVATDAQASATAANSAKTAAATSATNAANSATAANTSKTNAATSATNAAKSEANAADSATAAAGSATAANSSKTAAATSATNAANSATRAETAAASIASGPVTSVNGKTGAPVLNKTDIGLSLVDNVSVREVGIGKLPLIPDMADGDSLLSTNGWFSWGPNTTGTKPSGRTRGIVLVSGRAFQDDARITQLWLDEATTRIFARTNLGGTWSAWVEVTFPVLPGASRLPLTTGDGTAASWTNTLSITQYIDKVIVASSGSARVMNLAQATVYDLTLTANCTLSVSNVPALSGESLTLIVRIRQDASSPKTITWFSGITWLTSGGSAPSTPNAGQIIEYILSTNGDGSAWVGRVGAST